ncbi:MAG: TonB-dependent receptor [Candidatus Symbiothrix sp.]|nr:TonB-dependent receptor [Candidatus Symbiothrix sp.]
MVLLLLSVSPIYAQQSHAISGTVSSKGETLIGASVVEKGTSKGTVTDVDGKFNLQVGANAQLVVSYIGYKTKTVSVGKQSILNIEIEEDVNMLEEVVAIGYGVQQKKLITGATVQVKGDDISKLNTVSAMSALQSQAPGVTIVKTSGKPGDHFKINIRGLGTVSNSNPLYIVDGAPAGTSDDVINNLNPADIESIDVLKDAASSAIYGSRAANGVILITTKQGKKGKAAIQYDGYYGWQNVSKVVNPLNAKQYMDIYNESVGVYPADRENPDYATDPVYRKFLDKMRPEDKQAFIDGTWNGTNWLQEMILPDAPITNHTLNITGGSDASIYSIGFGYTAQSPIIGVKNGEIDPSYTRYTTRINTEHNLIKARNFDILKFGQTLQMVFKDSRSITMATQHSDWNDIHSAIVADPLSLVYNSDGTFANSSWDSTEDNPIGRMYYNSFSTGKSYAARGNFYFVIQPIKGLKYRPSFGINFSGWNSRSFTPAYELQYTKHNYTAVQQASDLGLDWNFDHTLTYDFQLNRLHNISAMLGQSFERAGLGEHVGVTTVGYEWWDDYKHAYITNAIKNGTDSRISLEGSPWSWRGQSASFFGRVNYDYNQTYMATFVLRYDGSSNFAKGHRWGAFPSVSAGWNMTNEPFMKSTTAWLDYLKLRGGWGQNGNSAVSGRPYSANITRTTGSAGYVFGDDKAVTTIGAYVANVPNETVSWETSEQINVGFDSWLLNNRLGLNFDYYIKSTIDWLVRPPVVATDGTGAPLINGGLVRNSGLEMMLTWQSKIQNDFSYNVSANFAYNKNEVIDIPNEQGQIVGSSSAFGGNSEAFYYAREGYPIGVFWGYKTDGIIQTPEEAAEYDAKYKVMSGDAVVSSQPGDVKYVDVTPDGIIDSKDRSFIGDPNPDLSFGLTLNLAWKGIDFTVNCNGVAGNQIARNYRSWLTQAYDNYSDDILGRWTENNHSNTIPRIGPGSVERNWGKISDIFIENGDYFRINNISLGYDFNRLFRKSPISQLRLYAQVQNLLTLTSYSGMDPEIGADGGSSSTSWAKGVDIGFYPASRTFLVGLSIKY